MEFKYGMGIAGVSAKLEDESLVYHSSCNISEIKRLSCKEILSSSVERIFRLSNNGLILKDFLFLSFIPRLPTPSAPGRTVLLAITRVC